LDLPKKIVPSSDFHLGGNNDIGTCRTAHGTGRFCFILAKKYRLLFNLPFALRLVPCALCLFQF
ncbi:MAG: hypothetical protein PVJ54_15245, partial [Desulfobacterales bacterium]